MPPQDVIDTERSEETPVAERRKSEEDTCAERRRSAEQSEEQADGEISPSDVVFAFKYLHWKGHVVCDSCNIQNEDSVNVKKLLECVYRYFETPGPL